MGAGSDFEMNLKVDAGAIIFGMPSFRPMDGAKGTLIFSQVYVSSIGRSYYIKAMMDLTEIRQVPGPWSRALREFLNLEEGV